MTRETKLGVVIASTFLSVVGGVIGVKLHARGDLFAPPADAVPGDKPTEPVVKTPDAPTVPTTPVVQTPDVPHAPAAPITPPPVQNVPAPVAMIPPPTELVPSPVATPAAVPVLPPQDPPPTAAPPPVEPPPITSIKLHDTPVAPPPPPSVPAMPLIHPDPDAEVGSKATSTPAAKPAPVLPPAAEITPPPMPPAPMIDAVPPPIAPAPVPPQPLTFPPADDKPAAPPAPVVPQVTEPPPPIVAPPAAPVPPPAVPVAPLMPPHAPVGSGAGTVADVPVAAPPKPDTLTFTKPAGTDTPKPFAVTDAPVKVPNDPPPFPGTTPGKIQPPPPPLQLRDVPQEVTPPAAHEPIVSVGAPAPAFPPAATPAAPAAPDGFRAPARVKPPEPKADSFLEEEYRVQAGDNYASISQRYYFSDKYRDALARYNKDHPLGTGRGDGATPAPGSTVYLPPMRVLERRHATLIPDHKPLDGNGLPAGSTATPAPTASPARLTGTGGSPVYRVRASGETLREIARRTLGDSNRWSDIYRLNARFDASAPLPGGTLLLMPAAAKIEASDRP